MKNILNKLNFTLFISLSLSAEYITWDVDKYNNVVCHLPVSKSFKW